MAELSDAADLSPLRILLLLQDYGQAHAAQYRLPSDAGNQALGDAARAIYAYTDAREAAARADERAKVAEDIREAANREDFEGTSWQAGMAYAHRIALGHAVSTSSENPH